MHGIWHRVNASFSNPGEDQVVTAAKAFHDLIGTLCDCQARICPWELKTVTTFFTSRFSPYCAESELEEEREEQGECLE